LSARAEAHWREDDDVIQSAVAVQVHRQKVGVSVSLKWLPHLVATDDLRTRLALEPELGDQCTMEPLRLWKSARNGGKSRPRAARGGEREKHHLDPMLAGHTRRRRRTDLQRVALTPIED
jgi:hypothetical protein